MKKAHGRFWRRVGAAGGAFIAGMVVSIGAHADSGTGTDSSLSEVVVTATHAVTATKTDTPLVEIPQSISIITADQILDQGALTMQQSLAYTAGVSNQGNDSRGDFNIIRSFLAEEYLDGLKRNFGFVYLPQIDVYTLDRLDVLLGPSAVLYGAGSSGGLVNMVSKRPQSEFGGEITASYGTYDRKEVEFDVTGPLSDTMAGRLVGVYRDSQQIVQYLPDNRTLLQPSFTWKPSDRTSVTVIGLYQRDYTGPSQNYSPLAATLYAPTGRAISPTELLGEPSFNKGPKEDGDLTLLIDHSFNDALKLRSSTRIESDNTTYGEIYGNYYNPLDPWLDANDSVIPRALFAYKTQYRTAETDNSLEFNTATGPFTHKILGGVDYSYFHQVAEQAYGDATPLDIYAPVYGAPQVVDYGPTSKQILKDLGIYAQDQIHYEELATLVLGLRHDDLNTYNSGLPEQTNVVNTYRAGLTVNVGAGISPYASFSESFQPVTGLNQFNQSFIPLYGKSYEVGAKWQPLADTLLRVALYDITERNHLVPDPTNPVNSIQTGKAYARGFEFQVDHRIANDITLTASYTHAPAKVSGQDRQEDNTPEETAGLFATKYVALGAGKVLRGGAGVRYVGPQIAGDPTVLQVITPSYTLFDAMLAFDWNQWSLQLNAINVADRNYYAGCSEYGSCASGQPRTLNIAGTYRLR